MKNENLTHLLKNGSYFELALDWYFMKHMRSVFHLHWVIVLSIICALFVTINVTNLEALLPTMTPKLFVKQVDGSGVDFHIVKSISKYSKEDAQVAIARYLLKRYVLVRESYEYSSVEDKYGYIKANSSYKVYLEFKKYMDSSNAQNPVVKYKYNGRRTVEIISVAFENNDAESGNVARIKYKSENYDGKMTESMTEEVKIKFTLSDVKVSASGLAPLEFVVHSYEH